MLSILAVGCHDYVIEPNKPSVGEPTPGETSQPISESSTCSPLSLPTATAIDAAPTCSDIGATDWTLVVKSEFSVPWFVNGPIAAPVVIGEPPSLFACGGHGEFAAVAPWNGDVTWFPAGERGDCQASAWALGGDRAVGALGEALDQGQGSLVVSDNPMAAWLGVATEPGIAPLVADLDHDGVPEAIFAGRAIRPDGTTLGAWPIRERAFWEHPVDVDGDGALEILTTDGLFAMDGTRLTEWPSWFGSSTAQWSKVVAVRTTVGVAYFAVDGHGAFGLAADGTPVWSVRTESSPDTEASTGASIAVGDADGDGEPDLCLVMGESVVVLASDGTTLLSDPTGDPGAWTSGGCALADLDADGNHEGIVFGSFGLRLYDVETESLLSERSDFCSETWESTPIVADVDGDGSAEIVVNATYPCIGGERYFLALGPASGRWARTRPVWNQVPYDPVLVGDDGRARAFPPSNPLTINAFRAQPARDGDRPDLAPEIVDACATDCQDGVVVLSARVRNTGGVEAAVGARIAVLAWTGERLEEIGSGTIEGPIPAGYASAAITIEVPSARWGKRRVIDVHGDASEECDPFNDRLEDDIPDPCPPG